MTSTTPDAQELAALRARAYGPRADIDSDPVALARLRELEAAGRASARSDEASPSDTAIAGEALNAPAPAEGEPRQEKPSAPAVAAAPSEKSEVTARAEPAAPRRIRPIPRGWIIAWAASIVAVALIVGGTVFGLASIRPVSTETGAVQVATLDQPVSADDVRDSWFPATNEGVIYRFEGLIVAATGTLWLSPGQASSDDSCLYVGMDGGTDAQYGAVWMGCAAGSFPAAASFVVGVDAPRALRDRFPVGTALQFVLDGDRVGVFRGSGPTQDAAED